MLLPRILRRYWRERLSAEAAGAVIEKVIRDRRPFSLVRLGDGEGAMLGYDPARASNEDMASFRKHFGPDVAKPPTLLAMRQLLIDAILDADMIGVRGDALTDPRPSMPGHGGERMYHLHRWWSENHRRTTGLTAAANLPWDLAVAGFWGPLLSREPVIGLVNASPDLPPRLRGMLGREVIHFRIPERHHQRSWWADDMGKEPIFPDAFDRVARELTKSNVRGMVVLVGAGVAGKAYCRIVREQGGIALDVGSLLDAWDGRDTRPGVIKTKSPGNPTTAAFLPI